MSSQAPTKRDHPTLALATGGGLWEWSRPLRTTTVGNKFLIALTGMGLVGFVTVHLIGNLNLFAGPDGINGYANFLRELGPALWVARGGLLAIFALHLTLAIRIKRQTARARPVGYHYPNTVQASLASRYTLSTGVVIGLFLLFHLAHFTFGWVATAEIRDPDEGGKPTYVADDSEQGFHKARPGERVHYRAMLDVKPDADQTRPPQRHELWPDVYRMVIAGFSNPWIAGLYLIAQVGLGFHLSHGAGSMLQTLGANGPRLQTFLRVAVPLFAWGVVAGNCIIVLAVYFGLVGGHSAAALPGGN